MRRDAERAQKGIAVWTSGQVRFVDKVPSVHLGRCFGIRQKSKLRVIDDYSVFGHNDATTIPEKITLGSVDDAVLIKLLISTVSSNSFSVTLSDGTVLQGDARPDWRREGLHFVGEMLRPQLSIQTMGSGSIP